SSPGAAPVIDRPDLVGVQQNLGVFLSKLHGLMGMDARNGAPLPSCALKLAGDPKNFLFHGNEIVVVTNSRDGTNRSALVRYAFDGQSSPYLDAVRLSAQRIVDARSFDSTIVAYTTWFKDDGTPTPAPSPQYGGAGGVSNGAAGAPSIAPGPNNGGGDALGA